MFEVYQFCYNLHKICALLLLSAQVAFKIRQLAPVCLKFSYSNVANSTKLIYLHFFCYNSKLIK